MTCVWLPCAGVGGLVLERRSSVTWRIQTCQPIKARDNIQQSPFPVDRWVFLPRLAMQISPCPIALPLGKLSALAGVKFIAVHCSATRPTAIMGVREIHRMHVDRGFACVGYHYVIRRDGTIERGRPEDKMGAHVEGHNRDSLGICLIGGIDADGKAKNNFTQDQFTSLKNLLLSLHGKYPKAIIQGHRDFFGDTNKDGKIDSRDWLKECPCFDVKSWWSAQT